MRLIAGVAAGAVSRSLARSEVMRALPPGLQPGKALSRAVRQSFQASGSTRAKMSNTTLRTLRYSARGSQMPGPDRLQVERQVAARRAQLGRVMAQAITVCFWPRPGCAA